MATHLQQKAPAATGACQSAQQCELVAHHTTLVSRGEYGWNVFYGGKMVGSFLGLERANMIAIERVKS